MNGYKCFNKNLTNIYGFKFEINTIYSIEGNVEFGINRNGFHFCKNLDDTLRFFDAMNNEVIICEVIGSGNILIFEDDYNGYYDMYAAEKIKITKILTREEIIGMALKMNFMRAARFVQGYRLTDTEIEIFKNTFYNHLNVLKCLDYYQNEDYIKSLKKKY